MTRALTLVPDDERAVTERAGTFTLALLPSSVRPVNRRRVLEVHRTVLRPLLAWATECWAYGLDEESDVYRAARNILVKEGRRYRVRLDGDPLTGRELFWNASRGRRGTIVIAGRLAQLDMQALYAGCSNVWTYGNFRAPHTPAALRAARALVADGTRIAFCLPSTNGIEWLDVYARPDLAVSMLDEARVIVPRKPLGAT